MGEYISNNLDDTKKIAANFAETVLEKADFKGRALIIGLYGELGSGKTTFMKFFAEKLGVEDEIQSPTFVIMKFYKISALNFQDSGFNNLVHIDAYRLDGGEDLVKLGWEEIISDPKNIVCIEWPERIVEIMPEHIMIRFDHGQKEDQRKIDIA